jgi:hypothetical protein
MSEVHSTTAYNRSKPAKPYPEYPLTAHRAGLMVRKGPTRRGGVRSVATETRADGLDALLGKSGCSCAPGRETEESKKTAWGLSNSPRPSAGSSCLRWCCRHFR